MRRPLAAPGAESASVPFSSVFLSFLPPKSTKSPKSPLRFSLHRRFGVLRGADRRFSLGRAGKP